LHFCQWTDALDGWITKDVWEAVETKLNLDDFAGKDCYGGLDMSYTRDLSACAWVFPADDGTMDAFVDFWKPGEDLEEAIRRDRAPYDQWAKDGYLNLTDGKVIKLAPIGQRMGDMSQKSSVKGIGYDRYRHRELDDALLDLGIELPLVEHPQGFRRANVIIKNSAGYPEIDEKGDKIENPLWMPSSLQHLENAIIEKRIRINYNPVLRWNASSAVIRQDPAGTDNRIFDKRKSVSRIDGIVALAMAVGLAKVKTDCGGKSVYETRGVITL
jgi:phage terminase large subunit-like protein